MFRVFPDPLWKLGTASDIRNAVTVAKVQGQNAELISISVEFMNILLGALCNTVDSSFSKETGPEEFQ